MLRKFFKISFIFIFIVAVIFVFSPRDNILVLKETNTGRICRYFNFISGDEFVLLFTHSINKRPVYEYIKNEDGKLLVYKSTYDAFGAGMPETSMGSLKVKMQENGIIELTNINRKHDKISLFVGTVANHKIFIHNEEIALNTVVESGSSITFEIITSSYINLWKEMFI